MKGQAKFVLFKLTLIALGIGAALLITPACKAQSEISPDHFDGTDSYAVAAQTVNVPVQKRQIARAALSAKSRKTAQSSPFHLAAAREVSKPLSHDIVAAGPRRKTAPRRLEKQ